MATLFARFFSNTLLNQLLMCLKLKCLLLVTVLAGRHTWCSGQTTRRSPLRFRLRSPVRQTRTQLSCEMTIVNALPKVVGSLRILRFPPTGNAFVL